MRPRSSPCSWTPRLPQGPGPTVRRRRAARKGHFDGRPRWLADGTRIPLGAWVENLIDFQTEHGGAFLDVVVAAFALTAWASDRASPSTSSDASSGSEASKDITIGVFSG